MKWGWRIIHLLTIAALGATVWTGIGWGLPSRMADHYLFVPLAPWTGSEMAKFDSESTDGSIGADVDLNPIDHSQQQIILNDTDDKRAEIVRRYRLYSNQPDEMITFRALQRMKPSNLQFDPHLYQYGGLWIYGTGAALKIADALHLITITADKTFYYDHPEEFAKFYVVARTYTLICYVLLLVIVGRLAQKLTHLHIAIWCAILLTGVSPVVFAMAHEAKPHLPGVMLMCLACLLAMRYMDRGKIIDLLLTAAACGLAMGMVLSSAIILSIVPTMILLRKNENKTRIRHVLIGISCAIATYFITNPYVLINLLIDRPALISNLGNTQTMYHLGSLSGMLQSGLHHLQNGASIPLLILSLFGLVFLMIRRKLDAKWWILLIPVVIVLIQFTLFSENKPGEYARFVILPVVFIALMGSSILDAIKSNWISLPIGIAVASGMIYLNTWAYVQAFETDSIASGSTRMVAAAEIDGLRSKNGVLQIMAEPAPYSVPPVGLWGWKLILTSPESAYQGDVVVRAVDDPAQSPDIPGYTRKIIDTDQSPSPITWANKPIVIYIKNP